MGTSDLPAVHSLNALLEDERASVEIEVALINGATEQSEREAFSNMGTLEVGFCLGLRAHLERLGSLVTPRVNGLVLDVLGIERYDERLIAFADHQIRIAELIPGLMTDTPDDDLGTLLRDIEDAHLRSAAWSRRRASAFATTRMLVFRGHGDAPSTDSTPPTIGANGARLMSPTDE